MTFSGTGSVLAGLTERDRMGKLARRVKDMAVPEFVCLLDFITAEFQQYLRAIDLIDRADIEVILDELLDGFTLKIEQILQVERAIVFLADDRKHQLRSKVMRDDGETIEICVPDRFGILGRVAQTGKPIRTDHPSTHPAFDREVDRNINGPANSLMCVPIFSSKTPDKVVAVVQTIDKLNGVPFSETDEQEFNSFASSIGIILESCQAFYTAARNQRGVSALLEATTLLGQSLDLETTLRAVMDRARDLLQADRSTLFLLEKDTGELWTKVTTADGKETIEIRIPSNKGIAGYVASTGQPLNIPDAYLDPRFDPSTDKRTGYRTRNILCMPVFNSEGELIGVTQLINKKKGSFSTSDEFFMKAFNIQSGIALENARLFQSVSQEKQYQKDVLQSLSDAVISTDMEGRIVTINEAALALLGCPVQGDRAKENIQLWEQQLTGRFVWEIVAIDRLQSRIQDVLETASRQYVPEQSLTVSLYESCENASHSEGYCVLAVRDRDDPTHYLPWGETAAESDRVRAFPIPEARVKTIERSLNLTLTPLTNPEGGVRGGLVVLEDISREKRMKTTMYRYMTPGVAERVMALGEDALMVGERKEVTILFSDIRGYTTLTENLGASEVVTLLNQYFETMVEAVFNHEGTLDKFIGDALMAVFGAPLPLTENHAWMAVRSALDMRRRLEEFNRKRVIDNQPEIRIGIGIGSGEVVSGNIGSQKRMDYTVIGDGVNLSARLESLTKEYGCDIIISEQTYNLCGDRLWVRELDKIRVKGKQQAVNIYELIGDRAASLSREMLKFMKLYEIGRQDFLQRDFEQAIDCFEAAQLLRPDDRAVNLHLERSRQYLQTPPPDTWDGVRTMLTK